MLFPAAAVESPIQFGPYMLTECVGQGGMAVVYKAQRQGPSGFAKTVVVKAMLPTLSAQREFVAMFSAEARLMASLVHPNIVQVQDFGVVDGVPYLVMEYLPGRNLAQLRSVLAERRMKLPVGAALTIAREMCAGLGFAHNFVDEEGKRRRVIHRDVSPSNVMVCRDGSVKLLDFGVAKIVGEFEFDVTQSLKGKYAYMAPEQVGHQPIDCRVDVFAAGVVLHELLTGKRLFAANTELETLQRVSLAQVIAPSVDNRDVPRALDAIVKKALARHPDDRYASAAQLVEALETLDALAWPRKRVAGLMAELFAHEWLVVCEVCGKGVMPATECQECGTRAPDPSSALPVAAEVASVEAAPLQPMAASTTDRNPIRNPLGGAEVLAPLPPSGSEPLPLPPPPVTPVPRRAPKLLPNDSSRRRLQVVRTPVPPPLMPPLPRAVIDSHTTAEAAGQIDTDKDVVLPPPLPSPSLPSVQPSPSLPTLPAVQSSPSLPSLPAVQASPSLPSLPSLPQHLPDRSPAPSALSSPAPAPPRLFVVPKPEPTPLPPRSPFAAPAAPRPLGLPASTMPVLPLASPSTAHLVPRSSSAPLVILGLAVLAAVLFAVFAMVSRPPRPDTPPQSQPIVEAPSAPAPVATAKAAPATPPPAPAPAAAPAAATENVAPATEPAPMVASPSRPARASAPRHHAAHASRPAPAPAVVDERSVKEGRLVDPFAELK